MEKAFRFCSSMRPWIKQFHDWLRDGDVAFINPVALNTIGFFFLFPEHDFQLDWPAFDRDGCVSHGLCLSCNYNLWKYDYTALFAGSGWLMPGLLSERKMSLSCRQDRQGSTQKNNVLLTS